jgi:hypothetical protein
VIPEHAAAVKRGDLSAHANDVGDAQTWPAMSRPASPISNLLTVGPSGGPLHGSRPHGLLPGVGLVGLVGVAGLVGLVGLFGVVGLVGVTGPVGVAGLVGLVGVGLARPGPSPHQSATSFGY